MRRLVVALALVCAISVPASAAGFTAPEAPPEAHKLMPAETESFGEGLWHVITAAMEELQPSYAEALRVCVAIVAAALLTGLIGDIAVNVKPVITLIGTVTIGIILFQPMRALIRLGVETVVQISQYGRLLLPVMTGALAAQGAVTKSGALYLSTAFIDAILSSSVAEYLAPLVYLFLCVSVACNLFNQPLLLQIRKFIKWLMTWGLKIVLYVFTGYITISGVVSGTADAAMLKATKLTISGMVPLVGNILSDASEAVLVSAGIMKNAVGVYGLLVVIALWIGPFLQMGIQYLMLKVTSGITEMFGTKEMAGLVKDFSDAMGMILAMTGTVCLIFLISTICFMKGAA